MSMIETFPVGLNEFILVPKQSTWTPSSDALNDDLLSLQKCFDPSWLMAENLITHTASGRGLVYFFFILGENCVLRHYYRGGLVAKLSNDAFLFKQTQQSRPYKELNLLATLHAAGLNVPKPIAARIKHTSFTYTADVITGTIPRAQELHEYILQQALQQAVWERIGVTLRKMHDLQACHYDINVKNVLLQAPAYRQEKTVAREAYNGETSDPLVKAQDNTDNADEQSITIYLLDFDGCAIRNGDKWKRANLVRFKRSLEKQRAKYSPYYYDESCWTSIERGYQS
jgi:3-deoxy-D-manno-octulosonic acid kinase